ncbi:MAG: colicin uptake protein [Anaerolineae bacterium]|nr:colicin uptake protein [Anaerolineae bacterium]
MDTDMSTSVIRLKPQQYIHVLDNNTGVTRLEVGPQTITLRDHERLVVGPEAMLVVPPRHYCVVNNPVVRDADGQPVSDKYGQVKLRYGDAEIRFEQDPFPLYPGEELSSKVTRLRVVESDQALRLRALRDFGEGAGKQEIKRRAGDEWLFEGPGTYIPRVEVEVAETIEAVVIKPNQALRLMAREACTDRKGNARKAGEEWLVREEGAYLPGVYEEVVHLLDAYVLTDRKALRLMAKRTFSDVFNVERKAGDEWLVTLNEAETHIPDVYEQVVGEVKITTLNDRQWCIVLDPIGTDGKPQLGKREVRKGRRSFFLHPGESLEGGIQDVYVLGEQESLLLCANEAFNDDSVKPPQPRKPGDLWMIDGPADYIPPVQVAVVERRQAIPLDKNEGIYVRDAKTGDLRLVRGPQAYMLSPYEVLWEKDLPDVVEDLLINKADPIAERSLQMAGSAAASRPVKRDKTRAVVYHVPQNATVQIHDYKARTARVVFGPDLVMLGPDESFTVLSLSGGKPKKANVIKSLALLLGPDFMTDIFTVETADHARLQLQLSYNWHFDVTHEDTNAVSRLFQVPDFVGDACKAVASRVRGAVAGSRFEEFHRNSAKIIRAAVFGVDDKGHVRDEFRFAANSLVITNIDIQSVEPIDEETLKSLQKSVQIAIKITTDAQEAAARHDAERIEQEARAKLDRQGIVDKRQSEAERKKLIELESENSALEATGAATAQARANAEAERIKGEAAVNLARQEAEALRVKQEVELVYLRQRQETELTHQQAMSELEISKAQRMAEIGVEEFKQRVAAIGPETIQAIATAGPELQAKLLQGLGLQSVLITDGNSPINLFSTANGLLGNLAQK